MDVVTYAILKKKIQAAGTGIDDIHKDGSYIVFVMADGTEFRIEDVNKDIISVDIVDNYIVVTYEDGSTTTSDSPLPQPVLMTGATEEKDGTAGYIPAPPKGGIRYFTSQGGWDDTVGERLTDLEDAVPVDNIPNGSTLTSDGWAVATEEEVAEEFEQWTTAQEGYLDNNIGNLDADDF